ncbi:MAG: APC family permease, partial [candidate division FCPU426 bacterium]
MKKNLGKLLMGDAKDPLSADIFHKLSLVAFLAWVGLGADGLSSSAYGPEETFKALGVGHHHLALYLAIATAFTVFIISFSYNQIIELFPNGGGGYVVASKILGRNVGLVSGSALTVDYVLTIAISIAAGVDALYSISHLESHKLAASIGVLLVMIWLNLRGAKESIKVMLPIFLTFVVTHLVLIGWGILAHAGALPSILAGTVSETHQMTNEVGLFPMLALLLTAYSLGGGTYTGIEAVSTGLSVLREPRVKTGKRTMFYMATSLAFTAGGILLLYMLWDIQAVPGQTMNAVLASQVFGSWHIGPLALGDAVTIITIASEGALLFIAAQAGFVAGPSVLSNMAADSWVPHRFANLSIRLVRKNGVLLMGLAAAAFLYITGGRVDMLVVLYSINVFITFTLSQLSMCVHWWSVRKTQKDWKSRFAINGLGLALTTTILVATTIIKFGQGGWLTLVITGGFIGLCVFVRVSYGKTRQALTRLDDMLIDLPFPETIPEEI